MVTRLLTIMIIVMLALPLAALVPPGTPGDAPSTASSVVAKGKKHKHNHKNKKAKKAKKSRRRDTEQPAPQTPAPVPRTMRGALTQTFTSDNASPILVPGGAPGTTKGNANPYPSSITVSGFANGAITDVDLVIQDLSHPVPEDIDILLVAPDGRRALVMSDVGRIFRVTNIDLSLDDEAPIPLPETELDSGDYRPTEVSPLGQPPDEFPAPAPALDGSVALSTFDGANPNGTWQLFVVDDASGDAGDIRAWALRITAEVDTGIVTG